MADYLVLDTDVDVESLTTKLFDARKDPEKRSANDVTERLVSSITHPETGEEAVPLADVSLPIRNPDPLGLPNNVTLPDQAEGKGSPDADTWHERMPISKWGTVKTQSEMEEAGWFPEQDV